MGLELRKDGGGKELFDREWVRLLNGGCNVL